MSAASARFDLEETRRRLAQGATRLWSSIEELIDEDALRAFVEAEFPSAAPLLSEYGRREFLRLMGASLLLAGLSGCSERAADLALPYVTEPEQAVPGLPRYYATAVLLEGLAQPVLARVNAGRPTKLDGNPEHPLTRGSSDVFMQAAVLGLYDPDRSQTPLRAGIPSTWAVFERELDGLRREWAARAGEGLRFLSGHITSPTLMRQLRALRGDFSAARLHLFEPVGSEQRANAMRSLFGRDVEAQYRLESCEAIVCLEDDLLGPGPRQVAHARGFAERRGESAPGHGRVRLMVAESVPSLTGVAADMRLPVDAARIPRIASALAQKLGVPGAGAPALREGEATWVETAARELQQHAGRSLLTCGSHLPAPMHALAAWINQSLGNVGHTIAYIEPFGFPAAEVSSLDELARDMRAGSVDTLVILDSNPVYAAPGALGFGGLLSQVRHTLHVGLYADETAAACHWHLPLSHALESFGDARAVDGTTTIMQPLVAPLYSTRSTAEILAMLSGTGDPSGEELVRATWRDAFGDAFDARWRQALHDGFIADTQVPTVSVTAGSPELPPGTDSANDNVEVVFQPDPCVWDGRFANIAWLQELPKPLTKITWDCPVSVSPHLADRLRLANGDLVEVSIAGRSVVGPAWIMPGQAPNTVALFFGYGRSAGGRIACNLGYSAFAVRPVEPLAFAPGDIRRASGTRALATTQSHHRMEGFDFVREVSAEHPTLLPAKEPVSLYPDWRSPDYAWGMVIDLDRCIGCNACVTACNVENNVLVVGKEQVAMGRDMLWLRIDRYYEGDIENPRSFFQPVPCMHCEKAPCEMGCPVHATVHSPEGVNQMVYNRCIGTRTCSSYCPYKVRRFNWFDYRRFDEPEKAAHNPDVTVRSRGVMEKCTYCIQRIEAAHAAADKEGRRIKEGEVMTACQQACPASAITFGNIKDAEAAVTKLRRSGRNYALLDHLGTRPRTTYLARWRGDAKGEKGS